MDKIQLADKVFLDNISETLSRICVSYISPEELLR